MRFLFVFFLTFLGLSQDIYGAAATPLSPTQTREGDVFARNSEELAEILGGAGVLPIRTLSPGILDFGTMDVLREARGISVKNINFQSSTCGFPEVLEALSAWLSDTAVEKVWLGIIRPNCFHMLPGIVSALRAGGELSFDVEVSFDEETAGRLAESVRGSCLKSLTIDGTFPVPSLVHFVRVCFENPHFLELILPRGATESGMALIRGGYSVKPVSWGSEVEWVIRKKAAEPGS